MTRSLARRRSVWWLLAVWRSSAILIAVLIAILIAVRIVSRVAGRRRLRRHRFGFLLRL
jgi:hypothetical protein